ncbi:hypothetical protein LSH36_87g03001 [Paralvinella palmiformis]|uniref:VWFA domain-containing protein n=1 Tax=Paralvinella palmiformis TaxID=53620 RepID=A0AAD9K2S3_9ANNE|nr:hypothetical protein LSH36_87g03001 [Paralvinella palmiformis]
MLISFVVLTAVISPLLGQSVDKTLVARETGKEVVDAVVDRIILTCIFDNDKLMLKRMAQAESNDGSKLSTTGDFNGGIWRISKNDYKFVKDNGGQYFKDISSKMGVDFVHTDYSDLEKPLYSGLAASIKLALKVAASSIPWSCKEQAVTWITKYGPELGTPNKTYYEAICGKKDACDTSKADIVIVIDESGSIGKDNFILVKQFVVDLVGAFHVSADGIRIGIIKYASKTTTITGLGALTTTADVQDAVRNIIYSGSGTRTDLGLLKMRDMLHNGRGSEGIPQIGIILTDGKSSDADALKDAVKEISDESFTIFSVGVSGADIEELKLYSSDPDCLHVYLLNDFTDMTDFVGQIQSLTCKAPAELPPGEEVGGELGKMEYLFFRLKVKRTRKGVTIKLRMQTGSCKMYLSWKVRNPGPAVYDYIQDVTPNQREGGAMFIPWPDDLYYGWEEIYLYGAIVGGPGTIGMTNRYIMEYTDGMFSDRAGIVTANLVLLVLMMVLAMLR